jgi:hypothetical protein
LLKNFFLGAQLPSQTKRYAIVGVQTFPAKVKFHAQLLARNRNPKTGSLHGRAKFDPGVSRGLLVECWFSMLGGDTG